MPVMSVEGKRHLLFLENDGLVAKQVWRKGKNSYGDDIQARFFIYLFKSNFFEVKIFQTAEINFYSFKAIIF